MRLGRGVLVAGLVASLALTGLAWLLGWPGFFLFLLFPLALPWGRRSN